MAQEVDNQKLGEILSQRVEKGESNTSGGESNSQNPLGDIKGLNSGIGEINSLFENLNKIFNSEFVQTMVKSSAEKKRGVQQQQAQQEMTPQYQVLQQDPLTQHQQAQPEQAPTQEQPQQQQEQTKEFNKEEIANRIYSKIIALLTMAQSNEEATITDLKKEVEDNKETIVNSLIDEIQ